MAERPSDKSPDAFRTISEVADHLDLPQHVLRFWETKFTEIKPVKRAGGRRFYRPQDVDLLRAIRHLLYSEGYTIKGVQKILKDQGPRAIQAMGADLADGLPVAPAQPEAAPATRGGLLGSLLPRRRDPDSAVYLANAAPEFDAEDEAAAAPRPQRRAPEIVPPYAPPAPEAFRQDHRQDHRREGRSAVQDELRAERREDVRAGRQAEPPRSEAAPRRRVEAGFETQPDAFLPGFEAPHPPPRAAPASREDVRQDLRTDLPHQERAGRREDLRAARFEDEDGQYDIEDYGRVEFPPLDFPPIRPLSDLDADAGRRGEGVPPRSRAAAPAPLRAERPARDVPRVPRTEDTFVPAPGSRHGPALDVDEAWEEADEPPFSAAPPPPRPAPPAVLRRPTRGPASRVPDPAPMPELEDPLLPFFDDDVLSPPEEMISEPLNDRIRRLKDHVPPAHGGADYDDDEVAGPPPEYIPARARPQPREDAPPRVGPLTGIIEDGPSEGYAPAEPRRHGPPEQYLPPHLRTEPRLAAAPAHVPQPVLSKDDMHRLQSALYELGECRRLLTAATRRSAEG